MTNTAPPVPDVQRHLLDAVPVHRDGLTVRLACLRDGRGRIVAYFGTGTLPAAFALTPKTGCASPVECHEVSRATTVSIAGDGPMRLALSSGAELDLSPQDNQTGLFAGLNTILAFRFDETAGQVAEGLIYHHRHHGLQGALIVNRVPPAPGDTPGDASGDASRGDDAFAAALRTALAGTQLRVVLLDCPLPLGKPDQVAESHPLSAPDAPGKDRMAQPDPDPWRSALNEGLLHEVIKTRYLARARAVLTLDVCDVLAAPVPGQPSAFDLCVRAQHGVVLLVGRRIYPWRVRAGADARFGDHICQMFDRRRGFARWGVAPEKAGLQNTWRATRVAFVKPDPGVTIPFYRAMAIKVPGQSSAELAPKTALVEMPDLLALSSDAFGAKPVRPPVSKPRTAPKAAADAGRTVIITTMKNEGPFILEWLAYHRVIGVDDFLIYTNDCTDGTDTMLDLLQARGLVQHRQNPFRDTDLKPQHAALQAAEGEPVVQNCGWGICMDVDEFINIKIGDGTLSALYDAMGHANMISLTWRLFGNGDVQAFADDPVIAQFTRCAPEVIRKPHQAWGFKTLFRNLDIYKKLGVHRPKGLRPDLWAQIRWLNGSGHALPTDMFRNGWRSTIDSYGYDWVQLNHYAVRSAESFLVKRDRGRVNHVDRDQGLNYWFRMNHNVTEDRSILRLLPRLQAERARLMADPGIAAAHAHSIACHRAKIAELRGVSAHQKFYGELTGPRMERLCRMQPHFGSAVFAAGPQVVPDDLLTRDLPPDFFFTIAAPGGTPA